MNRNTKKKFKKSCSLKRSTKWSADSLSKPGSADNLPCPDFPQQGRRRFLSLSKSISLGRVTGGHRFEWRARSYNPFFSQSYKSSFPIHYVVPHGTGTNSDVSCIYEPSIHEAIEINRWCPLLGVRAKWLGEPGDTSIKTYLQGHWVRQCLPEEAPHSQRINRL